MGFNVTALAQKARTQTLIVDSDLDMGQYDVIATDVKGDTAEFSEFVGGVGNFESGLISGGLDVSGILHAESTMQVDGDFIVDGSINNVNITAEGAVTTAKSITANGGFKGNVTGSISGGTVAGSTGTFSGAVTGASFNGSTIANSKFNGVLIKNSGTVTVTPTSNILCYITSPPDNVGAVAAPYVLCVLPLMGCKYTGSIKIKNTASGVKYCHISTGASSQAPQIEINGNQDYTYTFTNASYLSIMTASGYGVGLQLYGLTLS